MLFIPSLSLLLMGPLKFSGLALATSVAAIVNFTLLYYHSGRKAPRPDRLGLARYAIKILSAAVLSGFVSYGIVKYFQTPEGFGGFKVALAAVLLSAAGAGLVYLVMCIMFRIDELKQIKRSFFGGA